MAQKQLECPPALAIADMWHLSDYKESRERHIPGEGLDISWIDDATRKRQGELGPVAAADHARHQGAPPKQTGETANCMMLGRETRFP